MVQFETIKSKEINIGRNNFLEIARRKAISDKGENEFIAISRGFVTDNGEKRYLKSFTIPLKDDVLDFVAKSLKEV